MSFYDGGNAVHYNRGNILNAVSVGGKIHAFVTADFDDTRFEFAKESLGFDFFDHGSLFVI